ncbi:hypothetical protein HN512_01425 [Candidatus Peregrinibacteria bacterium]|jgi:hypothetical protein|nr:hypothetical protein [Candidatus Peregrinibacteria bacterium]MBT3598476.1 hypothetical protein [Candidatus Peregrinibacteria bacterium]MBT4366999.1 hypothetical protein [Candidatus Peregrinibacteria bacterium]MBT4586006.1 hypothetical protein [Candidatus Peregrinibacteria bacterium]MBT6730855.1 hypothetical protein [Candidatus Peregrinibacteria bacterium]
MSTDVRTLGDLHSAYRYVDDELEKGNFDVIRNALESFRIRIDAVVRMVLGPETDCIFESDIDFSQEIPQEGEIILDDLQIWREEQDRKMQEQV